MGELDLEHRAGRKSRRKQSHAAVVQAARREIKDGDRDQVKKRGQWAAQGGDISISRSPNRLHDIAHQKDGQGAVNEKTFPLVVRVQRGRRRVPVLAQAADGLQLGFDDRQEALIRVQINAFIPIETREAKIGAQQEHDDKEDVVNPIGVLALGGGSGHDSGLDVQV